MPADIPLILLSGMGADERMFHELRPYLPEFTVPDWLPPQRGESLRSYARRMAELVGPDRPCFIGGASFGGFLALEMLPHLNAKACFLIGAVRSPAEYPFTVRMWRPARALLRILPLQLFWWASGLTAATLGNFLPRRIREFLWLGSSLDPEFFRWAAGAVLTWGDGGPPPPPDAPVYQIHGARDRILPAKLTRPTELVPRGGHVIALSHPQEVADFLRRHMAEHLAPAGSAA